MRSEASPARGEVAFSGPFSSIVGYHLNPATCGVAKFNAQLAERLGVPVVGMEDEWGDRPLLSLKWTELGDTKQGEMLRAGCFYGDGEIAVLWHDAGDADVNRLASRVFYAEDIGCPPLLVEPPQTTVKLFSFGMAHKLQVEPYAKVRDLLNAAGLDYRLQVSVALHEGTRLDEAALHFSALEDVLGADKVEVLGCLSDSALHRALMEADVVCAFFPQGVRANNTSVHAAMRLGKPVLTNMDANSPPLSAMDIRLLTSWPTVQELREVGWAAGLQAPRYDWPTFLERLCPAT